MDLINNINLILAVGGHILDMVTQFSNLINTVIRIPINFKYNNGIAGSNFPARSTFVAGSRNRTLLAIHCLGQYPGDCGLSSSTGAGKKHCMGNPTGSYGIGQGASYMLLLDNPVKSLGTVFAC